MDQGKKMPNHDSDGPRPQEYPATIAAIERPDPLNIRESPLSYLLVMPVSSQP
jgi:hypothetical protein